MAENDIQLKLRRFLSQYRDFDHEMYVVYLLVEIRKLIEHGGPDRVSEYQTLRFYCDWILHTKKSRSFAGMDTVFEEIFQDCKKHIEGRDIVAQKLVDFMYFSELRKQMTTFFDAHNFDKHILEDQTAWVQFIRKLLDVLTDQPITNIPNENIESILVSGTNSVAASIVVIFTNPIKDSTGKQQPNYQLINAF